VSNGDGMEKLIQECKTVEENSLYNAQAHYVLAHTKEKRGRWLLILPSVVAGVCGLLTAVGLPPWLGAGAAVGGFFVAVATILGVDKEPTAHRNAACQWTALRHEARALHETFAIELPRPQLLTEVRRIDDRYIALNQALPATDKDSFEAAREQIKSGVHEADFRGRTTSSQGK
jgi:hypothetical protein